MAERPAVNREAVGSSPTVSAYIAIIRPGTCLSQTKFKKQRGNCNEDTIFTVKTDGKLTRWKRQTEDLEGLVRHQYRPLNIGGIYPDEVNLNVNRHK